MAMILTVWCIEFLRFFCLLSYCNSFWLFSAEYSNNLKPIEGATAPPYWLSHSATCYRSAVGKKVNSGLFKYSIQSGLVILNTFTDARACVLGNLM